MHHSKYVPKVQNLRKLFSAFKASFANVICLQYGNHSVCMSHICWLVHMLTHILNREPNRRTYMHQSVMLTSLLSTKFNDALASTCTIEDMFWQMILSGTMDDWAPSSFHGHTTIDISNQYFTPAHCASQDDEQVPFTIVVDPDHILSMAMGNEYVHTEDNKVAYYEAHKSAQGTK